MKYCEECGSQLSDNAKFCKECGAKQNILQNRKENNKSNIPKKQSSIFIFGIILVCAMIFVVIFIWINGDKDTQKENNIIESMGDISTEESQIQELTEELVTEESQIQETTQQLTIEENQVQESTTEETKNPESVTQETFENSTEIIMNERKFEYVPFEYFMGEYECVNVEGCHISISEIIYEQPFIVITEEIEEGIRYRDISGSYNGEKGYLYFTEVKEYIEVQEINDIVGYYRHVEYGTIGIKDGKLYWIDDSRTVRMFERVE